MRNPEWSSKSIVQLIGWVLIVFDFVLVFGTCVGQGGGASQEPGSDAIRTLMFDGNTGRAALGLAGLGLLALFGSLFLRRDDAS